MESFRTPRFVLCFIGLLLATGLCAAGKITGDAWVYAFGVSVAGHAEAVVSAIRGKGEPQS